MHVELEWNGATGYRVTTPSGASVTLDSEARDGPSPMESLLAAVAGCMAIDIVHILKRMRRAPERLSARVSGERADDHPRRFVSIRLEFTASGGDVVQDRLEQSVELSFAKYCSVFHSLAKDTETSWSARIAPGGASDSERRTYSDPSAAHGSPRRVRSPASAEATSIRSNSSAAGPR